MKKSEKLFLAINEIDEQIIDEAKDKEQKPVRVQLEKRLPIKEIIAFAACIAVLAVGIFALVKFKLSDDIEPLPVQSDSSEYSTDSSDQSSVSNPEIDLAFSEQDKELQANLKELVPNAEEIDGMFTNLSASGEKYTFNIGKNYKAEYSLIPAGQRTSNGLFTVPQTYEEMEKLVRQYFSSQAADFYMENVCRGTMTENADGTYNVEFDIENGLLSPTFIEINGRMYIKSQNSEYRGMGIDCETAKITRQTDITTEFTYWGYDYTYNVNDDGDVYSERNGIIVKEGGVLKLHYFYDIGFAPEIPTEYTEQDLELQEIMETLKLGDNVTYLFMPDITTTGTIYNFVFPESSNPKSALAYIDVSGPEQEIDFPKSCDEFEQRLLEYFSQDLTNSYMTGVCKGTMTENADGTYSVITDKDTEYPRYIEINGRMFYRTGAGGSGGSRYYNTAKVIAQTYNTIIFSYACGLYDFSTKTERLVFERGGWKRDVYNPEGDKELQTMLNDILPEARDINYMFTQMQPRGERYMFSYNDSTVDYYPVTDDLRTEPNGLFPVPRSRSEMEGLLLKYFSQRAVKTYMENYSTGSMTKNSDGTYNVETDKGYLTTFIEIDGQLFYKQSFDSSQEMDFDPSTAKVISKTDKTIKFMFTPDKEWQDSEGTLVFERSGWKLNYFYWEGFVPEFPTEYTAEDEEIQEILETLSPNYIITDWFNSTGDYFNAYHFEFPELDKPDYVTYYVKFPTGNFADGEKYPQSYDELETLMLKYFTRDTVDYYMNMACRGTMTEISDATQHYSVTVDKPIIPRVIEIDGEMYHSVFEKSGNGSPIYYTAKVTSRTENSIKFSYIYGGLEYIKSSGILKYERGGWKLHHYLT